MSFDAELPFRRSDTYGFAMIDDVADAVHQDLRILLLTSPGEKTMDPLFGVGLKHFLFQNLTRTTLGEIESRIRSQVQKYLSFIEIVDIQFQSALDSTGNGIADFDPNLLGITISYSYGYGEVREIYIEA